CLDVGKRVIIVDDYHKLNLTKERRKEFLDRASKFSSYTFLFAQNLALAINEIVNAEGGGLEKDFSNVNILQFNRQRRNRLIENWLLLDGEPEDKNAFAHRLNFMETTITDLLGKNFVPSYPIYVLSVLQASETATQIDTRASTQGYYYEIFIKTALSQGKSNVEYNILETYLAHLSYHFFENEVKILDERAYQDFHFAHQNNFDIERSWKDISSSLIEKQIFIATDGNYHFAQKYLYYYFTAYYMQDHIDEESIQHRIAFLCQHLYNEEYSNILLFLAHLSKHPIIIQELINAAEQHFPDVQPASIDADVVFLNELDHAVLDISYEDSDHRENRKKLLANIDEDEQRDTLNYELTENDKNQMTDPAIKLNGALKTLQILGQVLKNFPGSIHAEQKYEIANSCYRLGLRSLASMYNLLRENETLILEDYMNIIKVHHPSMHLDDIRKRAKETIVGMGRVVTYGIVKRISGAVGSPDLSVTYQRLLKDNDIPSYNLVDVALQLDHGGSFPLNRVKEANSSIQNNFLALNTLRLLVVENLSLFPVSYDTRQKACEAVDVSYSKLTVTSMNQNIISKR
ncbi:hypothetical protein D8Y20_13435, partial [Mariprofundus sp. EBB-1]|uniref:STAND family AAA ATPase n=1 Tax=Mariprofundus sp. EBB-1 TaxID=2650971 RepID=UPI000F2765B6